MGGVAAAARLPKAILTPASSRSDLRNSALLHGVMDAGVGLWHAAGLPAPADYPLEFDPEITASIAMVRVVTHNIHTQGCRVRVGSAALDLAANARGAASAEAARV